ncbi:hypothetical protein [Rhodohalobacter barkolensis]|uniref:HTH cro/C1-type domain-containing protein n=1 Tax=Rhodohalobacter barkolensis TaxID=2053187 RepID=A0A2N0VHU4_9BACT|nr:hypothetical protein [Rhodohalobacter barkolensis]PKD43776.1 hypothetical protein CWD77_09460 [Rhodohalobacter barkolensis]
MFSTDKEFLEKCGVRNYSLITELKKGRIKSPSADIVAQIVKGTGCSGTWLLTGEGEPFKTGENPKKGSSQSINIDYAFKLLERIESKASEIKESELPEDVEVQLTRLLLKVLERREQ